MFTPGTQTSPSYTEYTNLSRL